MNQHERMLAQHSRTSIGVRCVLGAILLTAYLGGSVATHVRADSPLFTHALFGVYVGIVVWAGIYLRDSALPQLLPIRKLIGEIT